MRRSESRFRRDISDWLDGRLGTVRQAVRERHLQKCVECRREWKALASVKAALQKTSTSRELPKDVAERLHHALDHEEATASARGSLSWLAPTWRLAALVIGAAALAA